MPQSWQPGRRQFLVAIDGLLAVKGRVSAGNANGSSFYTLLTSGQMPRGQAKLSTTLLSLVAAWISAGAMNN